MVMDKFEAQFADLDVQTSYMEDTMGSTVATSTPQDQVDLLLQQTAEEAQIELQQNFADSEVDGKVADLAAKEDKILEEDKRLAERLRALRPAT
jgi:charged multivesicular body protein 1